MAVANFANHVEVDFVNEKLIVSITGLRFDRPARIDDIG